MYFWDIETMINFFSAVFIDKSGNQKIFIIFENKDQRKELLSFIKEKQVLVGFNSHRFDHQVIEFMLANKGRHDSLTTNQVITEIYNFVQNQIINAQNENKFLPYSVFKFTNPSIDIMKTLHLDGKAKMCSLKWCEFSMDWENLLDMPIHHSQIITSAQIDEIIEYNMNDVLATKALFDKHLGEISLRKDLSKEFGIDLMSASEPRIAKEIFGKYLRESMNIDNKTLKSLPQEIKTVAIKDLILPVIKFKTKKYNDVLEYFKTLVVDVSDNKIVNEIEDYDNVLENKKVSYKLKVQDCILEYGLGGLHGFWEKPQIFNSDDDSVIIDSDFTSYYPHFNFIYGIRPKHLPAEVFNPIYKGFFDQRKLLPKSNPKNYVFKIILNSNKVATF